MIEAKNKKVYLEVLRVLAIVLVIFQHTVTKWQSELFDTSGTAAYLASLFLSTLAKIAVPIFFMISGSLLLGKQESLGTLYKKRVARMLAVLLVCSVLTYLSQKPFVPQAEYFAEMFRTIYTRPVTTPYWYLYTYISVLILLPFLRALARNMQKEEYIYLLIINLVFVSVLPLLDNFLIGGSLSYYFEISLAVSRGTFFMLIGYGLDRLVDDSYYTHKNALLLALAGLIFTLVCCLLTHIMCLRVGYSSIKSLTFYNHFVSIPAISAFFIAKYITQVKGISHGLSRVMTFLGANAFGIYLMEDYIREKLLPVARRLYAVMPHLPAVFILVMLIFVIGTAATLILKRIPGINKMI